MSFKDISINLWQILLATFKLYVFAKCKASGFHLHKYFWVKQLSYEIWCSKYGFRSFHSYAEISNILYKIKKDAQNVETFAYIFNDGQNVQVFNGIRGSDSRVYYKKAVIKKSKNFTEKKPMHEPRFK